MIKIDLLIIAVFALAVISWGLCLATMVIEIGLIG